MLLNILKDTDTYKKLHFWFFCDNYPAGSIFEMMGDLYSIDDLDFNLRNKYISTRLKSRFLFSQYEEVFRSDYDLVYKNCNPTK